MLDEELLAAAQRRARLLLRKRDPWNRLHHGCCQAIRDRRYGPHRAPRAAELTDLGGHDTPLRFDRLQSTCLLDTAFPRLNPDLRCPPCVATHVRRRSPAHRVGLPPVVRDEALATVDPRRWLGRSDRRPPSAPPSSFRTRPSPRGQKASRLRSGARAARRPADARVCATRRRTTAAVRTVCAIRASHRARAGASSGARSPPGGRPCSTRTRRPCRCAAACRPRSPDRQTPT